MSSLPKPGAPPEMSKAEISLGSLIKHACWLLDSEPLLDELQFTHWDGTGGAVTRRFSRGPDGDGQIVVRTGAPRLPEVVAAIAAAMGERGPVRAELAVGDVTVRISRGAPRGAESTS